MNSESSLKIRHSLYLLLTSLIWGTCFVAQSIATKTMGPFTYNACRFFLGAAFMLPLAIPAARKDPRSILYRGGHPAYPQKERQKLFLHSSAVIGFCMFAAGTLQQAGLMYTTAGKSGFVTALYIILVPLFGLIIFRRKCSPLVWVSIAVAVLGFYLLCMKGDLSINKGDLITLMCSFVYAFHILSVDYYVSKVNELLLSFMQLLISAVLSLIPALIFETSSWNDILANLGPIAYAGVLSGGVAYTLQLIGQRGLNPTAASLLMSLESVISALAGWVILGETLTGRELFGCVLVFCGVILAQLPAPEQLKKWKQNAAET